MVAPCAFMRVFPIVLLRATLGLASAQGQASPVGDSGINLAAASPVLAALESRAVLMTRADAAVPLWEAQALATDEERSRRRRSAVAWGTTVGFTVGMVAGFVVWSSKKCVELDCAAKALSGPILMFGFGIMGVVVGAGIGYVIGSAGADHEQLHRLPTLRIGVRVRL